MTTGYEQKFADFLRMCDEAKKGKLDVVIVHDPETLGDDYAEIVESLNRLADAKLSLRSFHVRSEGVRVQDIGDTPASGHR